MTVYIYNHIADSGEKHAWCISDSILFKLKIANKDWPAHVRSYIKTEMQFYKK